MSQKNKNETYSCLEFSGSFLVPSFSIYLLEIGKGKERYFYIGMTGDSYYPSARSALHRLAGHIDRAKNSTQNQLSSGLKGIFNLRDNQEIPDEELKKLQLKMHHWAIPGFKAWEGGLKNFKKEDYPELYNHYIAIQEKVHKLENQIIYEVKKRVKEKGCLNKTDGLSEEISSEYKYILDNVLKIIQ